MAKLEIPYHKIDLDKSTIESVFSAIKKRSAEVPHLPVDVLSISNLLRIDPAIVKDAFMILHLYGYLKATFLPRCKKCDKILGKDEDSAEAIFDNAEMGIYDFCVGCTVEIYKKDDIEVELLFWLPKYES